MWVLEKLKGLAIDFIDQTIQRVFVNWRSSASQGGVWSAGAASFLTAIEGMAGCDFGQVKWLAAGMAGLPGLSTTDGNKVIVKNGSGRYETVKVEVKEGEMVLVKPTPVVLEDMDRIDGQSF